MAAEHRAIAAGTELPSGGGTDIVAMMQFIKIFAAILLASSIAVSLWWIADRPVDISASWDHPLASLTFAPFRSGQSPLTQSYATPEQIRQDLETLVGRSEGVRTYSTTEGAIGQLPEMAAKLGLKVTLGAWLGRDPAINDKEIDALIKSANDYPEAIQRVIVGNEVMLRGDLNEEQLIAAIRRVKAAIRQPVSTADVWAFYLKHPNVVRELDYLTIHILPFWEDEPVPIDDIEAHTVHIVERMRVIFPGKPILIGETGWPSIGRDRGPAVVNVVNEARFVRQMANIAAKHGFDYNIVEAFDQPWKSALENSVGAAWGILDAERRPKFAMSGAVSMVADWPLRALCAIAFAALITLILAPRGVSFSRIFGFALLAQFLAWLMVTTAFHCLAVTFRSWQYYWLPLRLGLPMLICFASLQRCRAWLEDPTIALQGAPAAYFGASKAFDLWRGQFWLLLSAFYAIGWTFLLLWDGRYRDIPEIDFALPVGATLSMLALRVILIGDNGLGRALALDGLFAGRITLFSRLLAWLLPLAAFAALLSEALALAGGRDFIRDHPTFSDQLPLLLRALFWNREMDRWAAMLLLWSLPFVMSARLPARGAAPING